MGFLKLSNSALHNFAPKLGFEPKVRFLTLKSDSKVTLSAKPPRVLLGSVENSYIKLDNYILQTLCLFEEIG